MYFRTQQALEAIEAVFDQNPVAGETAAVAVGSAVIAGLFTEADLASLEEPTPKITKAIREVLADLKGQKLSKLTFIGLLAEWQTFGPLVDNLCTAITRDSLQTLQRSSSL